MTHVMHWTRLVFLCLLLVIAFTLANGWVSRRTAELSSEETQLYVTKSQLESEGDDLSGSISKTQTPAYIEATARTEMQFVNPGELRFSFSNPEALYTESEAEHAIRLELSAF